MNTTSHPVAPEELMAYLDGELPAAEAQTVSTHVATCAECADLAEQFRKTSQWMSRWEVEPVPARLQAPIDELTVAACKPVPQLLRLWNRKPWAVGGGLLAAVSLAVALAISTFGAKQLAPKHEGYAALSEPKSDRFSGGGLEQLGKGESKQFDRLDRASKLMAPPAIKQPPAPAPMMMDAPPPPVSNAAMRQPINGQSGGLVPLIAPAPMIARAVSMVVVVKDFTASRAALDAILARHHGYSAQLNVTTPENGARAFNASLRIPAPELFATLAECKSLGRVENETQSGEEVTQQHTDLLARLHNARETEERLRAILTQRTGKVSDVLEVEESIARVRGEIEQMEAEQQTLEHRVDFATVDIQLTEQYKASLDTPADSTATRLHNAFIAGYRNASETILGIILFFAEYGPSILIWLAILGIPAWLLWRRRRRA